MASMAVKAWDSLAAYLAGQKIKFGLNVRLLNFPMLEMIVAAVTQSSSTLKGFMNLNYISHCTSLKNKTHQTACSLRADCE
jgi:hypothetical protein